MRSTVTALSTALSTAVAVVLALVAVSLAVAAPASATGTAYTWTGSGDDTSWGTSANWSPEGVPADGDSVSVQAPGDARCQAHVTDVPSGLTLATLTIDEYLFQGDPDSPCLTSISGGSITVSGQLTFHAGTIDTAITVAAGATATVTPGAAHDTTHFSEAVTVDGALNLSDNSGAEFLSLTGSPGITVAKGATLTTQGTNRLYADCCNSPAHLTNNGRLQLGGGTTLDSVELDQNALLNASGGATILTDFAPQTAGPGARWTGSGSWLLGYSSVTTASGTQTLGSGFSWQFGGNGSTAEEYLRGTFGLAGTGRFLWSGGAIGAAMTVGSGVAFTADGAAGPDTRYLDGQGADGQHVVLTNSGTMTFSGGAGWYGTDGAQLRNTSTGVLTLGAGTGVDADCCNTPASLVNSGGRVVVPSTAGTVTLANTGYRATGGTLEVGVGSDLELTGGAPGSLSTTTITGGGTVGIATSTTTSGTETVGDGTTVALENHGAITTAGTSTATLGGTGSFVWTGGSVSGALTVSTSTGQTVSGSTDAKRIVVPTGSHSSTVTFSGPTSVLAGTSKAPDTVQTDPGGRLRFTGTLSLRGNTRLFGGAITTSGTATVIAGTATAAVTNNATLTNTGALTVRTGTLASDDDLLQTAGSTTISAGATAAIVGSSSALRIDGGTLAGSGQVAGNAVVAAGTLAPGVGGTGTLTVQGDLTTTTAATTVLELGSGGSDLVTVSGSASLKGVLRLADLGSYQPSTGDDLTVVTGTSVTAKFSCTTTTGTGAQTQHWTTKVVQHDQLHLVPAAGPATSC